MVVNTVNQKLASTQKQIETSYEIHLFSGGKIYTDNAKITDTKVIYKNKRGVVVSIDIDEIETMKKIQRNI